MQAVAADVVCVVPLSQQPVYNDKRRSRVIGGTIPRVHSVPKELSTTTMPKKASANNLPAVFTPPGE